jgi:hypothetical protein
MKQLFKNVINFTAGFGRNVRQSSVDVDSIKGYETAQTQLLKRGIILTYKT